MNELTIFNYDNKEVRTIIDENGDPWWVAKDVCNILEISNSRMALQRLDDDEKGVSGIDTPGGVQKIQIVNEPGLYSLIVRSDKPNAKEFKRWITHEVLPSIRKTGLYLNEKQNYNSDVDPVIAMAEGILAIRRKQLELEKQQVETDNRLSIVEKHLSGKAKIQDALPDVKEKTLRNRLNEIIRSYTNEKPGREFKYIWNVLYSEFLYRNRINLKIRAGNLGVSPLDYAENAGLLKDLLALAIELFC